MLYKFALFSLILSHYLIYLLLSLYNVVFKSSNDLLNTQSESVAFVFDKTLSSKCHIKLVPWLFPCKTGRGALIPILQGNSSGNEVDATFIQFIVQQHFKRFGLNTFIIMYSSRKNP